MYSKAGHIFPFTVLLLRFIFTRRVVDNEGKESFSLLLCAFVSSTATGL